MRYRRTAATAVLAALLMPATVQAAPPIAGDDSATTMEDTAVSIDVFANDSDPDGDELDIAALTQPDNGVVQFGEPFGTFIYSPRRDFFGIDDFTYTVVDGNGGSAMATVWIFVVSANDPPVVHDRSATVVEDSTVTIQLQARDPDPEGCDLDFYMLERPQFGIAEPFVDAGCSPNGDMVTVRYMPLGNFDGDDVFTYGVSDGAVLVSARVFISVTPVNDQPAARAGLAQTMANEQVSFLVDGHDWETCDLTFAVASQPANGTLSGLGAVPCVPGGPSNWHEDWATITYTPAWGFDGLDSFGFTVSDGTSVSAVATVTVIVRAPLVVHVGDLDATTVKGSGSWRASVTVAIDNFSHAPMSGAHVQGVWGNGLAASCVTSLAGTCTFESGTLPRKIQSTTFRVTSATTDSRTYDSAGNHDPDGDSDGTLITINRP